MGYQSGCSGHSVATRVLVHLVIAIYLAILSNFFDGSNFVIDRTCNFVIDRTCNFVIDRTCNFVIDRT